MAILQRTRIGVLGGTFDPPHFGHLAFACEVLHRLRMAKMLMMVANDPWQKSAKVPVTPAEMRLQMVRLMVAEVPGIEVCAMEISRGGASYMADTLTQLRARCPLAELMLVVGSDAAAGLETWKRPAELRALATIVVAQRAGRRDGCPPDGWPALVVDVPALDISSCDVRARFAEGRPVEALVPGAVAEYVRAQGLYGCSP